MKKSFKIAGNVLLGLLLITLLLSGFYLLSGKFSGNGTPSVKGYQILTVLSGSMEPAFSAGDVIFVKPVAPRAIRKGDIITFRSPSDPLKIITHRVTKIITGAARKFETKGDANDGVDTELVPSLNIIGQVKLSLPFLGYVFNFAKTKLGFVVLVIIPGLLIIANESRNIIAYIKKQEALDNLKEPIHD